MTEQRAIYDYDAAPTDNHVVAEETPRSHFTMIPNMIDDLNLDPYAFRLYAHLRRVAGESWHGSCWQSTEALSEHCNMSAQQIAESKLTLCRAGLILVMFGDRRNITIVDIWRTNAEHFSEVSNETI